MWIYLGLLATVFLSLYNLCKKYSVDNNAVIPVLLLTTFFGLLSVLPLFVVSKINPELLRGYGLVIPDLNLADHGYIIIKSVILSASWLLSYYALKNLPFTIAAPIRAAGPFFTMLGALLFYGERPVLTQWLGFVLIIGSMILYSNVGKKEGIDFKNNRWIFAIALATMLGSFSGLYDKFLIQHRSLEAQTVQLWCSFYIVIIVGLCLLLYWLPRRLHETKFQWRWSIPLVGILLAASDFFYFRALQDPAAMIMILSALKRSQILVTVLIGGLLFNEKNRRKKLIPLLGVILGVALIMWEH